MTPTWTILIASVYTRSDRLSSLLGSLQPQLAPYEGAVTVLIDRDDCDAPVGVKRTRLVEAANATYVSFVDDDDEVADDYVARIMDALSGGPDCVGFWLAYQEDGKQRKPACHSLRYSHWGESLYHYERTPNHLNPVRREIALAGLPFRDGFGEDREWSDKIRPLLQTEAFLDWPPVYSYRYDHRDSLFAGGARRVGYDPGIADYPYVRCL